MMGRGLEPPYIRHCWWVENVKHTKLGSPVNDIYVFCIILKQVLDSFDPLKNYGMIIYTSRTKYHF